VKLPFHPILACLLRVLRYGRGLLVPLLLLASLPCAAQTGLELQEITGIEFVAGNDASPPSDDADWKPTMLPWGSVLSDPDNGNVVYWFRFTLDKPPGNELQALYFFRYNQSIDVWFNGERIGGDSYRERFQTIAWNHPRLVDIQNSNWQSGPNQVHVRFQASFLGGLCPDTDGTFICAQPVA
jgi:hypothetical protein